MHKSQGDSCMTRYTGIKVHRREQGGNHTRYLYDVDADAIQHCQGGAMCSSRLPLCAGEPCTQRFAGRVCREFQPCTWTQTNRTLCLTLTL